MRITKFQYPVMAAISVGLAACASSKTAVPKSYIDQGFFKRHEIGVHAKQERLEITLNQNATGLSIAERGLIRNFIRAYNDHGHGPLMIVLPEGAANQQFAVQAVAEAREIAFQNGVEYEQIHGRAEARAVPTMTFSFKAYDAIAPDCETFATVDFADVSYNGDLPNMGCSVRTNMAAMIADPADLLGTRELDPADVVRRQTTFEAYRNGEQTASERNEGESGTVSDAVDGQ